MYRTRSLRMWSRLCVRSTSAPSSSPCPTLLTCVNSTIQTPSPGEWLDLVSVNFCSTLSLQVGRQSHRRLRQPVPNRDARRRRSVRARAGQQHVHLPRPRSRVDPLQDAPRVGRDGRAGHHRARVIPRRGGTCGGDGVSPTCAYSGSEREDRVGYC